MRAWASNSRLETEEQDARQEVCRGRQKTRSADRHGDTRREEAAERGEHRERGRHPCTSIKRAPHVGEEVCINRDRDPGQGRKTQKQIN